MGSASAPSPCAPNADGARSPGGRRLLRAREDGDRPAVVARLGGAAQRAVAGALKAADVDGVAGVRRLREVRVARPADRLVEAHLGAADRGAPLDAEPLAELAAGHRV